MILTQAPRCLRRCLQRCRCRCLRRRIHEICMQYSRTSQPRHTTPPRRRCGRRRRTQLQLEQCGCAARHHPLTCNLLCHLPPHELYPRLTCEWRAHSRKRCGAPRRPQFHHRTPHTAVLNRAPNIVFKFENCEVCLYIHPTRGPSGREHPTSTHPMDSPTTATDGSPRPTYQMPTAITIEGGIAVSKTTWTKGLQVMWRKMTKGVVEANTCEEEIIPSMRAAIYNPDATPEERTLAVCCLQFYMQPGRSLPMRQMQELCHKIETSLGVRPHPPLCQPRITDRGAGGGLTFALMAIKSGVIPPAMATCYIDMVNANAAACPDDTFKGPPLLYPFAQYVIAMYVPPLVAHARMLHRGNVSEANVGVEYLKQVSDAHACYFFVMAVYTNVPLVVVAHAACNPLREWVLKWYCGEPTPENCVTVPSLEDVADMLLHKRKPTGRIRLVSKDDVGVDPAKVHVWPAGFPTPDVNMIVPVPSTLDTMMWQLANGEEVYCAVACP